MNIETTSVQRVIEQINNLFERYEKLNEVTGDNFNVFRILKLEASEVRMHSAFLAELLNPKGSHGQKDTFLKLFIEKFCFRKNLFDAGNCSILVEKYLGPKDQENTTGGRLDICIRDKNDHFIVIENKIYAPEQPKQLERYHKEHHYADLFYLTLDGSLPSTESKGVLVNDEHFKCLSYQDNILGWLEDCRKEVATLPLVREAISHYINLIKYLTNQTTNHNMEQELTQLMTTNLKAAFAIEGNLHSTLQKISESFGTTVEKAFNDIGLNCEYEFDFNRNYSGVWIWKEEWDLIRIGFQFQSKNHNMVYGLTINGDEKWERPMQIPENLMNELRSLPNNEKRNDSWWPWFNRMDEPYKDWNRYEAYDAINDGRMLKILIEKTNKLLIMTEGIKL
jgi:PD-(D/E)XK nuclease superfamily